MFNNTNSTNLSAIRKELNIPNYRFNHFDDPDYIYLENKSTLKAVLKSNNLLNFYLNGTKKYYADGASFIINGVRQKFVNAYGIGKNKGKYLAFITNSDGDPLVYFEEFEFEDDACEALFEKIKKIKD